MSAIITWDLEDPNIKEKLATLPEKMLDYAEEVLVAQANVMKAFAQVFSRVETGSLRDSIRIERGGIGLAWRQVSVRAGGYITNPKTGKLVDYAVYVEAKYPFMAPAFELVHADIADMIKAAVVDKANAE